MSKTITITQIRSKDRKHQGIVYPGEIKHGITAVIVPGVSIRIFGTEIRYSAWSAYLERGSAKQNTKSVDEIAQAALILRTVGVRDADHTMLSWTDYEIDAALVWADAKLAERPDADDLLGHTRIRRTVGEAFDRTFGIGDSAEYDSYNLSYYGPITSITAKGIGISKNDTGYRTKAGHPRIAKLDISAFVERNRNFDLAEKRASNHDEMMYL